MVQFPNVQSDLNSTCLGYSAGGLPVIAYAIAPAGFSCKQVLVIGGVHGNEPEGVAVAYALMSELIQRPKQLGVTFIPVFNPDGLLRHTRHNAHGVDLNRNLPTKDWDAKAFNARYQPGPQAASEPESGILVNLLDTHSYSLIISFHSFERYMINVNGDCTPYDRILSKRTGYPIEPSIGYPTPGCLGTYAGIERAIPTITYELERGREIADLVAVHVPAVLDVFEALTLSTHL